MEQLYANRLLVLLCLSGFILAAVTIFAVVSDQSSPVETCEIGHWCFKGRFMYACPPGRFGNSTILDNSNCSGLCEAGYECLAGSITSRGAPHGRDGGDRLCPQGYYCGIGTGDATLYPCLAGKYGTSLGLSNPECDGNCAAGFYCPEGSSSRKQIVCPRGHTAKRVHQALSFAQKGHTVVSKVLRLLSVKLTAQQSPVSTVLVALSRLERGLRPWTLL